MLSPAFPEIISPLFPQRTNLFHHLFRHFAEKINIDTGRTTKKFFNLRDIDNAEKVTERISVFVVSVKS
ncbi:MAG: hypothetical protein D3914_17845 [Candidatus Electrothrix sp. LOE2]|nr:hypothetical protein [Candidatus Electrothrix sp. LOE2]